uniref:(northern house mosquito) hypothetical protein n=1 Tax=Culex pipiens TaxID=7175 RepID=A0A8D8FW29_CULPI
MWRQNYGTILPARAGPVLAQQLPQMLLLRRDARGHRLQLLHPQRYDPVQGRLLQVGTSSAVTSIIRLGSVFRVPPDDTGQRVCDADDLPHDDKQQQPKRGAKQQ